MASRGCSKKAALGLLAVLAIAQLSRDGCMARCSYDRAQTPCDLQQLAHRRRCARREFFFGLLAWLDALELLSLSLFRFYRAR